MRWLDGITALKYMGLSKLGVRVPSSMCAQAHRTILMLILARAQAESFVLYLRFGQFGLRTNISPVTQLLEDL